MKYYTAGFMFTENFDSVVLIKKTRPEWQRGNWNAIGGHVEENELKIDAQVREFEEETGVRHEDWNFLCDISDQNGSQWTVRFYWCNTDKAYEATTVTDEEVRLHRTDGLPANIISNLEWLIPMAILHDVDIVRNDTEELAP